MERLSTHAKGLLITATGVLVITPDTLLIRLIASDQWTLLLWRNLLMTLALGLGLAIYYRGKNFTCFRSIGRAGLAAALLLAATNILFVTAIAHTSVANTLIIVSASPLFAAILSQAFLKEQVARRTWIAVLLALGGVAVIVAGSLSGAGILGSLAALGASLGLAASFTVIRGARAVNMIPAAALSALIAGLCVLPLASPLAVSGSDVGYLCLMGLLVLPVSFALTTLGPRYIPSPEVSLLTLLETFFGPLWVWLALGETPTAQTLLGGSIVIGVLIVHSLLALYNPRAAPA